MTAHMSTAPVKGTVLNFNLSPAEIHRTTDRLIAESTAVQDRVAAESRPTFESVIVPLATCENEQSAEYNVVTFVQSVSTDKEVRDASTAAEEKLREFEIESQMREDVYKVVRAVFDNASEMDKLGAEDRRLVEKMELGYRRNGLALDKDKREQLGVKQKRLSELEVRFSRNINENDGAEAFTREELVGLPDDFFEGRQIKIEDGVEKFVVTTKYPDLVPLLKKAKNETTRRRMLYADETRCPENIALMQEAVRLRLEIAQMLGYKTHAEFKLELSMAKAPATVLDFEDDLRQRLEPLADRELKEIEALKRADKEAAGEPYEGLFSWDFRYYSAMVLERKHQISDDEVKQYFSMQSVLRGVLDIYERMLSLKFVRVENAPVWHPDVELYEVWEADGTTFTGHFYLDLYPRESKYSHAAAFPIRSGFTRANGTKEYPVTAMVTNFPKPTPTTPALQKHDDVITLLHEFGHVMHGICSRTKWARFHGTSTEGDFVECPSQMLENWGWEPSALQKFAVHYQTGEPIPTDLIKRLVAAKNEGAGLFNLRQIFFGLYDMSIHHTTDPNVDVKQNFLRMREQITHFSNDSNDTWGMACFGHMLGGYDAGYFGYLWSLVYASDLFESRFKHDLESAKAGADYRHEILLPGGSRDSMISLERFLGRKPNNKAFLRSIGLN